MRRFRYLIWAIALIAAGASHTACSDEKTTVDPSLGELSFIPSPGAPGTLQEAIYNFYDRYGIIVRTDFTEKEIRWGWTGQWYPDYTPVQPGYEEYALQMLAYINGAFEDYNPDLVRRCIAYQIFLVDRMEYQGLVFNIQAKADNAYVIGNIGPSLPADKNTKPWTEVRDKMMTDFINKSYDPNVQPDLFYDLAFAQPGVRIHTSGYVEDPYGEYIKEGLMGPELKAWYSHLLVGYIDPVPFLPGYAYYPGYAPSKAVDYADYLAFLTSKPYDFVEKIMVRFPWCRKRALALIDFLVETRGMNLEVMQGKNCPADPLPAGYYTTLKTRQFDDSQLPVNPYRPNP